MSNHASATNAWEELQLLTQRPQIVACCGRILTRMLTSRRPELAPDSECLQEFEHAAVPTPLGDAAAMLRRGPEQPGERALAAACTAAWLAEVTPATAEAWQRLTADALWLASRTAYDPFPCIDHAFGNDAPQFWSAFAHCLTEGGTTAASLSRGDRALGAVLLNHHQPGAADVTPAIPDDDALSSIAVKHRAAPIQIQAEWCPAPRSGVRTLVYGVTGILLLSAIARLVLAHVLRMREPATIEQSAGGLRIATHKQLLGQRLFDRTYVISPHGLAAATRETRYAHAGLYAGIVCLLLGSYLGVSWLVDGVRAGSPSLMASGLLVFAIGAALDYAFGRLLPARKGETRLLLTPKNGRPLCLGGLSEATADDVLARLRDR